MPKRQGVVRCENAVGERDIGDIPTDGMDAGI
jgi:hypothetical protein